MNKNSLVIWFEILIITAGPVFYSCKQKEETDGKQRPVAPATQSGYVSMINMDSLRMAIKDEVREEERMKLFTHVDTEDNPYIIGGVLKTEFIFSEHARIYALPDTTSKVEAVLPFATNVVFIEGVKKSDIQGVSWVKIRNPFDNAKTAYLKRTDLADYCTYAYGTESAFLVSEVYGYNDSVTRAVEIRRYKKDVDTIIERYRTVYLSSGYRFNNIYYTVTLKAGDVKSGKKYCRMLVYETFRMSCPGGGTTEFIVDDGTKLSQVVTVSTEGEGGYYDMEVAYIPMKFENGKILLVANADVRTIFNSQTADLNIIPYLDSYKVPIENIVIVKHEDNGYNTNADFDVDPENVKVNTKLTIYQWDGEKLNKIKELK